MQDAQTYLEIVRSRGERRLELRRVYHNLRNKELFLRAYAKLYANKGALTPGSDPSDTVDAMSLKRIDEIIEALAAGTYRWKPTRRVYIPKRNGKLRPLGLPSWNDKLLQEVLRMILAAYYEAQFSAASHGFRQGRGCHTALGEIMRTWRGTKWFIEGDIKGCFDHIDHQKLLAIMGRSIKDERLLKLLREMLDAGYLEDWQHRRTYSGTPQGGVISPLLANIFLNELDAYVEQELLPQYTKGGKRQLNPKYLAFRKAIAQAKEQGDEQRYRALRKDQRRMPSVNTHDPNYRRLRYIRYADDFLLGFAGPKEEADEIKAKIGAFLQTLGLTLSQEKTLVTHATEGNARFLGYEIQMAHCDTRMEERHNNRRPRRSINGTPIFRVPLDVAHAWKAKFMKDGVIHHRAELLNNSDFDIVVLYQQELRGLVNYYSMAHNVANRLGPVKWVYEVSLVKTLARKHKQHATWVYRNYKRKLEDGLTAIVVEIPREGRTPLVARFGLHLRFDPGVNSTDTKSTLLTPRNELVKRLLAERCELCDAEGVPLEGHHVRRLSELKKRYRGRREPPRWVKVMVAMRRKTLMVCEECHQRIANGSYDGPGLK